MSVRQQAEHLDVNGQGERIGHDIIRLTGRNVDLKRAEGHFEWRARRRPICEIESDPGLDEFRSPDGLQVSLQN